jgi:hypothetical protein
MVDCTCLLVPQLGPCCCSVGRLALLVLLPVCGLGLELALLLDASAICVGCEGFGVEVKVEVASGVEVGGPLGLFLLGLVLVGVSLSEPGPSLPLHPLLLLVAALPFQAGSSLLFLWVFPFYFSTPLLVSCFWSQVQGSSVM